MAAKKKKVIDHPSDAGRVVGYVTVAEREEVERAAKADGRSIANWVAQAVRAALKRESRR